MSQIIKILVIAIGGIVFLALAYVAVAFVLSRIGVNKDAAEENEVTIYILSNGVHTDIVVPVKTDQIDWSKSFKFENTRGNDTLAKYIAFGWGDKGFYLETPTWADLKFSTAFKAAFALSTSAIHATFYRQLTENEQCKKIKISKAEYQQLIDFIKKGYQKDKSGNPIWIKTNANYGNDDAFYEGVGSYSLFYTCNTWTNDALKSCGQRACLWTAFDKGILYQYSDKK